MNGTARAQANRTLLAALIATVGMLFTAFAAAYLERQTSKGFTRIDVGNMNFNDGCLHGSNCISKSN